MPKKKMLVILGHPDPESFNGALAAAYTEGAREAGAEVRRLDLAKLRFDPVLWKGYSRDQSLEPDLEHAQQEITWAEHVAFIYPTWWGTMPALLKGFLDRVFLPRFAFKYQKGSPLPAKLLKGRTARLLVTMDAPTWYYRLVYGAPGQKAMVRTVLKFCGIKPVRVANIGPVRGSSDAKRAKWLAAARAHGRNDA